MRFFHIADLHIGKRVNEFNMIEDQRHILNEIASLIESEAPDAVFIAGDVYDKSQPSAEAVELLDYFLTRLSTLNTAVFMISGNHDSPERLNFASRIMEKNGLYISGMFDGKVRKVVLNDEYGKVNIYMIPFLKPAVVRQFYEGRIESYDDALKMVISNIEINREERNVLISHQFAVSGSFQPELSDSENVSVGGIDSVDISVFEDFDYVALGHIHRPQKIGRDTIRYAGSPLKYSFSESRRDKSVTVIHMSEKSSIDITFRPLKPLRDLREIKGPIDELLKAGEEDLLTASDYLHITLTDEEEIYDAIGRLRHVYPNIMQLDFENNRTRVKYSFAAQVDVSSQTPADLFSAFYLMQNNSELDEEKKRAVLDIFEKAGDAG